MARRDRFTAADTLKPAGAEQVRRGRALIVLLVATVALGALRALPGRGHPFPACPAPALRDGLLVCDGRGAPPGARAWLAGQRLDLNAATAAELARIEGVGPSVARAIVQYRQQNGPFPSMAAVDAVRGVGAKTLARLQAAAEVPATSHE